MGVSCMSIRVREFGIPPMRGSRECLSSGQRKQDAGDHGGVWRSCWELSYRDPLEL
jgi:hypothetical protein